LIGRHIDRFREVDRELPDVCAGTEEKYSQEDAYTADDGPVSQDFADGLQPANLVVLAATPSGRIRYILSTERDRRIRLISARDATRHERRRCEQAE
jgi:uncharacterized DUF497 family protein